MREEKCVGISNKSDAYDCFKVNCITSWAINNIVKDNDYYKWGEISEPIFFCIKSVSTGSKDLQTGFKMCIYSKDKESTLIVNNKIKPHIDNILGKIGVDCMEKGTCYLWQFAPSEIPFDIILNKLIPTLCKFKS